MSQTLKNLTYIQSISSALRMSIGGFNVLYLLSLDISLSELALLQLIFSLTVLIVEVPSGYLSDRWNRKHMVFLGTFMCAIFYIVMYSSSKFEAFVLAEIIYGFGLCFISGSFEGWVSEEAKRCNVNYYEVSHNWVSKGGLYSTFGGMLAICVAYTIGSFEVLYLLVGISFIVPLYMILNTEYMKTPKTVQEYYYNSQHFTEQIMMTFKDRVFLKYSILLAIFTATMQTIYHFWQPLFFGSDSSYINNYHSKDGIILMALHGGIFFSQYVFNKNFKMSSDSRLVSVTSAMMSLVLLFTTIILIANKDVNGNYLYISMILFVTMHGFLSLIPPRIQDFLSENRGTHDFGFAFSVSEGLARVLSIFVLFVISLFVNEGSVHHIFIIPCLGLVILGHLLSRFILRKRKEVKI